MISASPSVSAEKDDSLAPVGYRPTFFACSYLPVSMAFTWRGVTRISPRPFSFPATPLVSSLRIAALASALLLFSGCHKADTPPISINEDNRGHFVLVLDRPDYQAYWCPAVPDIPCSFVPPSSLGSPLDPTASSLSSLGDNNR